MDGGCQGLPGIMVFHATRTLPGNVQRCHAIAFRQGGEVQDMVNKGVNIAVCQEPHLTDMDQLCCPFSDDLYAQQALALWISDQLEEAVRHPGDLATHQFVKPGSPHQNPTIALPRLHFVQSNTGHLGNSIEPHRDQLWRRPHFQPQGMKDRPAPLTRTSCSMTSTRCASFAPCMAAFCPAGPLPMTTMS